MAKGKKKAVNRKKKGGRGKPLFVLLAVVAAIGVALLMLEKVRRTAPTPPPAPKPAVTEHYKLPPREEHHAEFQSYTTVKPVQPPVKRKKTSVAGPGSVAIIIDDMGTSIAEVKQLMGIKIPLTFSIIPGLAKDREVAEAAHRSGYEVMVHMPMEPKGYPQQRLEANGLLLNQDDGEIERRTRSYLARVPHAAGANNHMGSRFTEDEGKMRVALGVLQEKGLFFVDSRTSPRSVGYSLASGMGMSAGTRNVFLDNVQDEAAIRKQLDELGAIARKRGSAIGICHPHRATLRALASTLPEMKKEGITFVYASELVR